MSLYLEHIAKKFGPAWALKDINLTIAPSEFIAVLGPSGCGKTTLLRSVGGFIEPTDGIIRLNDQIYSGQGHMVAVEDRDLGMVFQSFALWPHMTVREHVEFPMKSKRQKHLSREKKKKAVERVIESLGLAPYADRLPGQLSGGQRQRVALARAIVGRPSILLMDEPLSALDAELKISMRQEIQNIHRRTGATILYVTHDQSEALAMADRILVMREGAIEQVGTPQDMYAHPETEFVASFVSQCNMVKGRWDRQVFKVADCPLVYDGHRVADIFKQKGLYPVRPEQFKIVRGGDGLPATIINKQYNGREIQYSLRCGTDRFTVFAGCDEQFDLGEDVYLIFDV
jgi:iron(III) transport system ATP-binding protein